METRRMRRFMRHQRPNTTLLPLHAPPSSSTHLSNTVSFFYCDYKFTFFNKPVYLFGRRYAKFLRLWFSIGLGFALSAMLAVTLILLWELATALHLCGDSIRFRSIASELLFGFPHLRSGLRLSLVDAGYICISTIVSVFVHEFGHALAATSEGVQVEYVAIFVAVLFPGALVAFNDDLLQALQHLTSLRIYSAGIWHNAVVKIPVFKVDDPAAWITRAEIYFDVQNTHDNMRLKLTRLSMEGSTIHWFNLLMETDNELSREKLMKAQITRYRGRRLENPFEELSILRQTGSVEEFVEALELLSSQIMRMAKDVEDELKEDDDDNDRGCGRKNGVYHLGCKEWNVLGFCQNELYMC
ncbi:unnamed protein product [Vicia faba]|uniref:Endopeptidase S2P n=1 Tax=Vicia faba TaxID=3906 RepID=A0AAV1AEI8_VICFA|nr:unnamed protein product [Vicia faba]